MPIAPDDRLRLLRIARGALRRQFGIASGAEPLPDAPALREPRAAFVTLTRRDTGVLRGCRGETRPVRPLRESVARMAVAAATDDPRFAPVTADELTDIIVTIHALTALAPIRDEQVVVGRHGLALRVNGRAGLLLPDVPIHHGWDRDAYLEALCRKAGVPVGAWRLPGARLLGFETETW